jgi:hypothetical protein
VDHLLAGGGQNLQRADVEPVRRRAIAGRQWTIAAQDQRRAPQLEGLADLVDQVLRPGAKVENRRGVLDHPLAEVGIDAALPREKPGDHLVQRQPGHGGAQHEGHFHQRTEHVEGRRQPQRCRSHQSQVQGGDAGQREDEQHPPADHEVENLISIDEPQKSERRGQRRHGQQGPIDGGHRHDRERGRQP